MILFSEVLLTVLLHIVIWPREHRLYVNPRPPSSDVPSVDSLVIVKCLRNFIFYFMYFLQGDAHVEKDTK